MSRGAYNTWMPLYVADYLRKTTRLTTEQHGAYCLLIMDYWVNGVLPDDDVALAQIVRLPLNIWRKHRNVIQSFFSVKDEKWIHDRIEDERMKAFAITEVKRKGGQERQRLSKQSAHAGAHATAERPAERPAETQQKRRPSPITKIESLSSIQSGSAREPQPLAGAGSALDDGGSPKPISSLIGKLETRLIEQVAASKKF